MLALQDFIVLYDSAFSKKYVLLYLNWSGSMVELEEFASNNINLFSKPFI